MQTYGEVDDFLCKVLEDKDVALIIYDSITATVPGRLTEKNVDEMNEPGVAARIQSNFMQKFKARFKNTDKTVIFVNQLRTRIAMGYGQVTKLTQAGGQALGYYMDVRIMLKKVMMLEQTLPGYEKPVPYGADLAIWCDKNRYARPLLKKIITIHFGKGISNAGAVRSVLEYHGIIERVPRKGWNVKYQNEIVQVPKDDLDAFLKSHLEYFVELADSPVKDNPNESDIKKCKDEENLSVLNDFEKVFYLVSAFETGIKDGGFEYFFLEEKGNYFKETINSLKEMKLDRILSIYEKVFKKFEDAKTDYDLRKEYFDKKITDSFEEKILRADELFLELPNSYFEHIKYEYIKNNEEKFK